MVRDRQRLVGRFVIETAYGLTGRRSSCRLVRKNLKGVIGPMANLTKRDISRLIASKLGVSRAHGQAALKAVLGSIQDSLSSGDRVVLTGFGSFEVRPIKARKLRPIRGGQAGSLITVPAHNRVGFKAGAELSKAAK